MYRILLVDDEVHICQLIQHLVNWEELDVELCGMAHDGVEAYEMVRSLHPDIVLSDIRMSGMDGIGLLEKVRSVGLTCAFILISGFRQFEYAQKAIHLGVIDYLVKPIKKKELNSAIARCIQAIQEQKQVEGIISGEEQINRKKTEDLVNVIEAGTTKMEQMTVIELAKDYGVSLGQQPWVIYGKCVTCDETFSPEVLPLLLGHVKDRLKETDWFAESFCAFWGGGCLLVGSGGQNPSLLTIQRHCQHAISMFANWRVVLGGYTPLEDESFYDAAGNARRLADNHYFAPAEDVFSEISRKPSIQFENIIDNRMMLLDAIRVLDAKSVKEMVKTDFESLEAHGSSDAVFAYVAWIIDATNHALSAFLAAHSSLKDIQYLHRNELLEDLYHSSSLRVLRSKICNILEEKIRSTRESIEHLENKPVRIVKEMVAMRYKDHISLNDAAELVDLNPVYLSVLFKKETGINFKDYVTNVRMENAKELLRSGEMINQVAELVGYQDIKYFSRLFTRVVGVTPAQYKKLYQ